MSANSNGLHAMRTLLQETQTVLSYEPKDMVVKGNDEWRGRVMVDVGSGEPYKMQFFSYSGNLVL